MTSTNPKPQRLTPRSVATRAKLVAVAERLFAKRGVEGVPLSEINKASGQRNANACQYHFGNKEGLLQAIVDKHVPGIAARRNELLDQLEANGALDLCSLVHAWVQPVAEKLYDPDGGREFIRVNAQLTAAHTLSVLQPAAATLRVHGVSRLTRALHRAMVDQPAAVRQQRLLLASILLFHGLADHSRVQESVTEADPGYDTELFVCTLEDSMTALLGQPLSTGTAQRLDLLEHPLSE